MAYLNEKKLSLRFSSLSTNVKTPGVLIWMKFYFIHVAQQVLKTTNNLGSLICLV